MAIASKTQIEPPAFRYFDADSNTIGEAVLIPSGTIMVWGHDYDAQPLEEGYLPFYLDTADDFASARAHIERHVEQAAV